MSVALDRCRFFLIYFLTGILGLAALSAEAKSNAADDSPYIPLDPPFVVNYGSGAGKIKFLKAELSVRADDPATANAVRHHMPLIRNGLILLLSSQTDETIHTLEGKQALREAALIEINRLLAQEAGPQIVVRDVLFNNLVMQ